MSARRPADRLLAAAAAVAAIAVSALVLWPSGDAPAQPELALTAARGKVRIENSKEGEAILGKRGWEPGERVRGKVAITNAGTEASAFRLSLGDVRDWRGPHRGRLSRATRVRVARLRPAIDGREVVFDGRLRRLRRIAVGTWPAGGTRHFQLRATLTPAGENPADRYQGARLSFGLRWTARARPAWSAKARPATRSG